MVVDGPAFGLQVIQPDRKFIPCANAPRKRGRNAALVLLGTIVVRVLHDGVEAKRSVLARQKVEVARGAVVFAAAKGVRRFVLVDQQRSFVDLVHHTAGGALAKQHGGRSFEDFDAVVVERVALNQRRIFHAVDVDVTRLAERKTAQAHVFFARFTGQKRHAGGSTQHFAKVILVAVRHDLFCEHSDRLGDVFDVLLAFANRGFLHAQSVFALDLNGLFDRDGRERGVWGGWRRLCHRTGRSCQHQGTQGQ